MKKVIKFLLPFLIFGSLFLIVFNTAAKERELEITYPPIPGVPVPTITGVKTGLPQYVVYIFNLSIALIGFVIFGAIIYSSVQYLLSAGNPVKLADAKDGIVSALLGAIILLGAYLIFITINPQLVIFELPEIKVITPPALATGGGIYLCKGIKEGQEIEVEKEDGTTTKLKVADIVRNYLTQEDPEKEAEAFGYLKQLMAPTEKRKDYCYKIPTSQNLGFKIYPPGGTTNTKMTNDTLLFLPEKDCQEATTTTGTTIRKCRLKYNYGVILHEKDNFKGSCELILPAYPNIKDENITSPIYLDSPNLAVESGYAVKNPDLKDSNRQVNSITIFKKPLVEEGDVSIVLYEGLAFNPEASSTTLTLAGGQAMGVKELNADYNNKVKSIEIFPQRSAYRFVILYEDANYKDDCVRIQSNQSDITSLFLHGFGETGVGLSSIIIIKGTIL